MDLSSVGRAAFRNDVEKWFPPRYSSDPDVMRAERQEALKAFMFGPYRTEDVQERRAGIDPVKAIPRIPYLECFADVLIAEPNLIVPKVRRMIQTLFCEGYELWRALERPSFKGAVVHANMDDGEKHIEQDIKDVAWRSLPKDLTDQFVLADALGKFMLVERRVTTKAGGVAYKPWRSQIIAFPATSRELRGWGASSILWDEFSTHPGAHKACKAILPTLFGRTMDRGQLIRMGTVNPDTASGRYFMELYERENFRRARMVAKYGVEFGGEGAVA